MISSCSTITATTLTSLMAIFIFRLQRGQTDESYSVPIGCSELDYPSSRTRGRGQSPTPDQGRVELTPPCTQLTPELTSTVLYSRVRSDLASASSVHPPVPSERELGATRSSGTLGQARSRPTGASFSTRTSSSSSSVHVSRLCLISLDAAILFNSPSAVAAERRMVMRFGSSACQPSPSPLRQPLFGRPGTACPVWFALTESTSSN